MVGLHDHKVFMLDEKEDVGMISFVCEPVHGMVNPAFEVLVPCAWLCNEVVVMCQADDYCCRENEDQTCAAFAAPQGTSCIRSIECSIASDTITGEICSQAQTEDYQLEEGLEAAWPPHGHLVNRFPGIAAELQLTDETAGVERVLCADEGVTVGRGRVAGTSDDAPKPDEHIVGGLARFPTVETIIAGAIIRGRSWRN